MVDCRDKNRLHVRRGEQVSAAVLTEEIVREIREAWQRPGMSQRKVAAQFKLGYSVVRVALEGRTWKHVTSEASR
jgi:ribosome-binding protein aMBF1 (putative translation factor)